MNLHSAAAGKTNRTARCRATTAVNDGPRRCRGSQCSPRRLQTYSPARPSGSTTSAYDRPVAAHCVRRRRAAGIASFGLAAVEVPRKLMPGPSICTVPEWPAARVSRRSGPVVDDSPIAKIDIGDPDQQRQCRTGDPNRAMAGERQDFRAEARRGIDRLEQRAELLPEKRHHRRDRCGDRRRATERTQSERNDRPRRTNEQASARLNIPLITKGCSSQKNETAMTMR